MGFTKRGPLLKLPLKRENGGLRASGYPSVFYYPKKRKPGNVEKLVRESFRIRGIGWT